MLALCRTVGVLSASDLTNQRVLKYLYFGCVGVEPCRQFLRSIPQVVFVVYEL